MLFVPEPRAAGRQKFCCRPECRKISRRESDQRWMKNTGNGTYHSGEKGISRVREWRKANPGYWRRRASVTDVTNHNHRPPATLRGVLSEFALQDICTPLQDSWNPQVAALVGLIGWLRGSALQETIARDLREIMLAGYATLETSRPEPQNSKHPRKRRPR